MKKSITLLVLILSFAITAFAGPVDPEKALEIANSFWKSIPELRQCELLLSPVGPSKSAGREGVQEADAQYYLFTPGDKSGFVIVSGEDGLAPVVGYSTSVCAGEMPPALAAWLADYSNFVDDVRAGVVEPAKTTATAGTRIEPMLQTNWNQSTPYNNYCPEINGQKTPTGCTATATAQVMKFHNWPEKPVKDISWYNNITGTTETINITQNTYEWGNMLNHYRDGYTAEQAHAVAQLMVDVGKAMGSSYALAGTGSADIYAARALVNVFDYSPEIKVYKRNECTYDEFIAIVRENLEARQPLVYSGHGQSYAAGHAFVCDGIDENNLLHIDWGWDGAYNGYFDMGSMAPGGSGIGGGQDRYNVGQSIIANIRPRSADDVDRAGAPSLYVYEVVSSANGNAQVEEYTAKFISGNASFRTEVQILNWSHSAAKFRYGLAITSEDNSVSKISWASVDTDLALDKAAGYYHDFRVNNSNSASGNYLAEGRYNVEVVYKVGNGEPVKMKGENNRLVLEVGKTSAKLSKAQPAVEVTGFRFRTTPHVPGDAMSFDVAFRNTSTNNATVVIVPIVNRLEGNVVVKSDTLTDNGVLINVFDNIDFLATYTVDDCFSVCGDYNVSFAYDLKNTYTNLKTDVENKRLKGIDGNSGQFTLYDLSDGPLEISSMSASGTTVGSTLNISAVIKNTATSGPKYESTIGLFVCIDGKDVLLATADKGIAKGAPTKIQFKVTDYVPVIGVGTYEAFLSELIDGKWEKIKYNKVFNFTMKAPAKSILYAASRIVIDDDNVAVQGDSVDVALKIGCMGGDFNGYVKVYAVKDTAMLLESDYIPASIKDGEAIEMNLRSLCGSTAPLGEWEFALKYYDADKNETGSMYKNSLTYPGNGNFWVADATAVDDVLIGGVDVVAGSGCLAVDGATAVKVSAVDGRTIYSGAAATIAVENGIYIVVVESADGSTAVRKVFVK